MSREPIVTTRRSTVRTTLLLGTAGALVLGGTFASYMRDSILLAQVAALVALVVLIPTVFIAALRNSRGAEQLLASASELDARRAELDAEQAEIAEKIEQIEERAARVENQYQVLCGLVNQRTAGSRPEEAVDEDAESVRQALEEALDELRRREEAEKTLADRIRELESARRRAEQELARLMSDSRERLQRERELSATARERKLARAEEDATESLKVRSAAATEAEELLLEARGRAQALLEEAEEQAARLAAQGREEFESALRELKIREDEEIEKGGQILADARIRAAELVTRAREQAAELVALGEAEFEALLEQISKHEHRERELYERVRRLEEETTETGFASSPPATGAVSGSAGRESTHHSASPRTSAPPDRHEPSSTAVPKDQRDSQSNGVPMAPETIRAREQRGDHTVSDLVLLVDPPSGPIGALRNLFGGLRGRRASMDTESRGG
jgi:hypothetical protein